VGKTGFPDSETNWGRRKKRKLPNLRKEKKKSSKKIGAEGYMSWGEKVRRSSKEVNTKHPVKGEGEKGGTCGWERKKRLKNEGSIKLPRREWRYHKKELVTKEGQKKRRNAL